MICALKRKKLNVSHLTLLLAKLRNAHFTGTDLKVTKRKWLIPVLSHMNPLHVHRITSCSILIFVFLLFPDLPSVLLYPDFSAKILCALLISRGAMCSAHKNEKL